MSHSSSPNGLGARQTTRAPDQSSLACPPPFRIDRDQLFDPDVARRHGLDPDTMAMLEIPIGSSSYTRMLAYAAHYAVDLHDSFPIQTDRADIQGDAQHEDDSLRTDPSQGTDRTAKKNAKGDRSSDPKDNIIRGVNNVAVPKREGPGRLSCLWSCPNERFEPFSISDSDSDGGSDSDSDSDSDVEDDINRDIASTFNGSRKFASLGALKKTAEPPLERFHMGLGYAKIRVSEHTIFLHHCAFCLLIGDSFSMSVYRTCVIVAEEPFALKELCAVANKWRTDRDLSNQRARPGRFTLFRFKTSGDGCGAWHNQGYKRSRPAKSVILPEGQLETIVHDIKEFVAHETKAWYQAHGLPHRRSYLYHGPPGSGKSSTIKVIAGMFRLNACFLSLTAGDFSNQVLHDALSSMPRRALLVLEDVDVLFNEDRKSEASRALTFSGLLNALDGLISVDGVITIFTTNHIEKLDAALIRGGRVDRRFEFVHPNAKQMAVLFKSFYPEAADELANRFASAVLERPEDEARSIATLQQHFIFTRKLSAEESVDMLPKFFEEFYPRGSKARNPIYL